MLPDGSTAVQGGWVVRQSPRAGRALLKELLRQYNEHPQRREETVKRLEEAFKRPVAILVLDSSGFTRTTHEQGIVHFLALLERLGRMVRPVIARHGGRVIKTEADNIFATFASVEMAVRCAVEIQQNVRIANEPLPEPDEIYVSIGIGYGEVLVVGQADVFGDEMNLTCKLGEDLARRDEILLTPSAGAALASPWKLEETSYSISGVEVRAYRVLS
jgi:class 3 adenylate cyclase